MNRRLNYSILNYLTATAVFLLYLLIAGIATAATIGTVTRAQLKGSPAGYGSDMVNFTGKIITPGSVIAANLPQRAANLAALRAITGGATKPAAYLEGRTAQSDGGEGYFIWASGNLAAQVAADIYGAIFVAPSSDLTGASGAWQRQRGNAVNALWFGLATGNDAATNGAIISHVVANYDEIELPPGAFAIPKNTIQITRSGQKITGVPGKETGTAFSTGGTIFNFSGDIATDWAFKIDGGQPTDRVYFDGVSLKGNGTGIGLYVNNVRQSTLSRLMFYSFTKCIHFESMNWLNKISDCKMFNYTSGIYLNSGSEDSIFENIIARGYGAASVGLVMNYYSQLNYFNNCDFSDNYQNVIISAAIGNPILTFISCTFEQGQAFVDNSRGIYINTAVPVTVNIIGCRMYYKESDAHKTSSAAFEGAGVGGVTLNIVGLKIDEYPLIFTASGNGFSRVKGDLQITSVGGYTLFSGVFGFTSVEITNNEVKNLLSDSGIYKTTHDFTGSFTFDLGQIGLGQSARVRISRDGLPEKYGEFFINEKNYYANGAAYELHDQEAVYTASVAGNTLTVSASSAFTGNIVIEK